MTFSGGILANDKGDILLQLRRDKKTWAIAGGAMELEESSVDTYLREFFEERGILGGKIQRRTANELCFLLFWLKLGNY
ncbi:hydrolase, NUDIX domain protein [Streptococcus pseudoporcinus LQ 940-04]|uniref:Hydrolase, NUDIX domain protein n=1 Tax=Streptococcus pseudoporcinus LQ 940-04 TaxID=875093 RepID=G5KB48_9STRE|nr:MutT/NUDIX family protein [Streptococcus pseudoporcinus SPIN 20026]EHI64229.1 hydrolase, NUDIX domain protein [Streptococcus pseudoporcinus LQ 940-04]